MLQGNLYSILICSFVGNSLSSHIFRRYAFNIYPCTDYIYVYIFFFSPKLERTFHFVRWKHFIASFAIVPEYKLYRNIIQSFSFWSETGKLNK